MMHRRPTAQTCLKATHDAPERAHYLLQVLCRFLRSLRPAADKAAAECCKGNLDRRLPTQALARRRLPLWPFVFAPSMCMAGTDLTDLNLEQLLQMTVGWRLEVRAEAERSGCPPHHHHPPGNQGLRLAHPSGPPGPACRAHLRLRT